MAVSGKLSADPPIQANVAGTGVTPLPDSASAFGELAALLMMRTEAGIGPLASGAKRTVSVQLPPAARLAGQSWLSG